MTLKELLAQPGVTAAALARDVGCHRSYITRARDGDRALSTGAAIKIWRARQVKVGPISDLPDEKIRFLEQFGDRARAA